MTATVIFLMFLALLAVAVERNHARQRYHSASLAGSDTATDRDAERISAELEAAPVRRVHPTAR
jgi:hypothetical protein